MNAQLKGYCGLCGSKVSRDLDGEYPRDCYECCKELYEDHDCDLEYLEEIADE